MEDLLETEVELEILHLVDQLELVVEDLLVMEKILTWQQEALHM